MIEVKSPDAANGLVTNNIFQKHNLRAFIPAFKVLRVGVIQDVPTQIDDESLKSSKTICIKHEVRPFIPRPRTCNACFRTGHVQNTCRGTPRCLYCGGGKHNESNETCQLQNGTPKCINCQGEHWANSSECPMIKKQHAIVNIAAVQNISIADAKAMVNSGKSSSMATSSPCNLTDFPDLPGGGSNEFIKPNRFGILGVDEQESDPPSYANVLRSRSPPRMRRAGPDVYGDDHSSYHQQRQKTSNNYGELHNHLNKPNGRIPNIFGNGVAFRDGSGTRSGLSGGAGGADAASGASELIFLISDIFTHFRNGDWPNILNSVIRLVRILSNMYGPPLSRRERGSSLPIWISRILRYTAIFSIQ
ncbi:hypothetical protein ALC57_10309 [Trachymyrmex cornetzi]|uniref:Nucleic-acid-binding protein from mobile element jockey n=1 Tax=Trachymyrmex cornetzi TaxID=471704 RepID=A0A151J490_9HYME|nr:hypothetical protein ALC57_10309 [Trachymyrmex cornetzi]